MHDAFLLYILKLSLNSHLPISSQCNSILTLCIRIIYEYDIFINITIFIIYK